MSVYYQDDTVTLHHGDCLHVLPEIADASAGLIVTSPPYFNARDYVHYGSYTAYLDRMEAMFIEALRVLRPGRFLAVNSAPVLVPRDSRQEHSMRLGVPYDLHGRIVGLGFEFVEDIVWRKPDGAGWSTFRGTRFAADRNPLAYKAVPVTEMVMIYRAPSDRMIDDDIRDQPADVLAASKVEHYLATNVWDIQPEASKHHPAVMPLSLAAQLITCYSFVGDVVLDPFIGSGTTAVAARMLGRRAVGIEYHERYLAHAAERVAQGSLFETVAG